HNGRFILRIDDTDAARSTQASADAILDGFRWLGIDWDEGPDVGGEFGPYRQSQRLRIYEHALHRLLEQDLAYPCFCSSEQLEADRKAALAAGGAPRYVGRCRDLSRHEADMRIAAGERPVYRLRVGERSDAVVVHDAIYGDVEFAGSELDDFVIWKADGSPTYHFASCVDDVEMKISHIIRAEEHLSNTPRHIVLFAALGAKAPIFAHVPMILAPDRSKLSKRHGATSVQEYRERGFLPEALLNGILLLGFSPGGDVEVMSQQEAAKAFDLARVSNHSAVYDEKKMEWMNGHWLRSLTVADVTARVWPRLLASTAARGVCEPGSDPRSVAWVCDIVRANRERARTLVELCELALIYLAPISAYDETGARKQFTPESASRLRAAASAVGGVQPFVATQIEGSYRRLARELSVKTGDLIHPTRLALTGRTVGPGLFEVMQLLGEQECAQRMLAAAEWIERKQESRA
ncbi:MAG: glutamate--tRNA ligase, partial [Firmicutes bacterium]|nr:glutamate--tRNA ligase [Bacillota bacterium]